MGGKGEEKLNLLVRVMEFYTSWFRPKCNMYALKRKEYAVDHVRESIYLSGPYIE